MELVNRNKYVKTDDGKLHRIIQRNPIFDTDNEKSFFELVCDDGIAFKVEYINKRHDRKNNYKYGNIIAIK